MKYFLMIILTSFSLHSFADCRASLTAEMEDIRLERKDALEEYVVLGPGLGGMLALINPAVGAGFISILAVDVIHDSARKKSRERLIQAIDESYAYLETYEVGPILKRVHRKIKRKADRAVDMEEVVQAIILSNENGDLCSLKRRNIRRMSKAIAIDLEN